MKVKTVVPAGGTADITAICDVEMNGLWSKRRAIRKNPLKSSLAIRLLDVCGNPFRNAHVEIPSVIDSSLSRVIFVSKTLSS